MACGWAGERGMSNLQNSYVAVLSYIDKIKLLCLNRYTIEIREDYSRIPLKRSVIGTNQGGFNLASAASLPVPYRAG